MRKTPLAIWVILQNQHGCGLYVKSGGADNYGTELVGECVAQRNFIQKRRSIGAEFQGQRKPSLNKEVKVWSFVSNDPIRCSPLPITLLVQFHSAESPIISICDQLTFAGT